MFCGRSSKDKEEEMDKVIRMDLITGDTVIISPEQEELLSQLLSREACPFEPGNEALTPPEVCAFRYQDTEPNKPGWWVRVIPLSDLEMPRERVSKSSRAGSCLVAPPVGYHYVIVDGPDHDFSFVAGSVSQIREVLLMWRDRIRDVLKNPIKCVLVSKSYDPDLGYHSHSQLIALPVPPPQIRRELQSARDFHDDEMECVRCQEIQEIGERLVAERGDFVAWCPYAARRPHQIRVSSKAHQTYFTEMGTDPPGNDPWTHLALLLQEVLQRIKAVLGDSLYRISFYVYKTSPNWSSNAYSHWYWQITPLGGLDLILEESWDLFFNPCPPEESAAQLRAVKL